MPSAAQTSVRTAIIEERKNSKLPGLTSKQSGGTPVLDDLAQQVMANCPTFPQGNIFAWCAMQASDGAAIAEKYQSSKLPGLTSKNAELSVMNCFEPISSSDVVIEPISSSRMDALMSDVVIPTQWS